MNKPHCKNLQKKNRNKTKGQYTKCSIHFEKMVLKEMHCTLI